MDGCSWVGYVWLVGVRVWVLVELEWMGKG